MREWRAATVLILVVLMNPASYLILGVIVIYAAQLRGVEIRDVAMAPLTGPGRSCL